MGEAIHLLFRHTIVLGLVTETKGHVFVQLERSDKGTETALAVVAIVVSMLGVMTVEESIERGHPHIVVAYQQYVDDATTGVEWGPADKTCLFHFFIILIIHELVIFFHLFPLHEAEGVGGVAFLIQRELRDGEREGYSIPIQLSHPWCILDRTITVTRNIGVKEGCEHRVSKYGWMDTLI